MAVSQESPGVSSRVQQLMVEILVVVATVQTKSSMRTADALSLCVFSSPRQHIVSGTLQDAFVSTSIGDVLDLSSGNDSNSPSYGVLFALQFVERNTRRMQVHNKIRELTPATAQCIHHVTKKKLRTAGRRARREFEARVRSLLGRAPPRKVSVDTLWVNGVASEYTDEWTNDVETLCTQVQR